MVDCCEIRMDLLRLVHRNDLTPEQLIARAREFEAYVMEPSSPAETPRPTLGLKKADKPIGSR